MARSCTSSSESDTFTLTATNLLGSVSATLTVNVGAPGSLVWTKTIVYGFGQELAEDQPGMGTTFIQSDFVGSPSFTTDASGAVIGRSKNLPFGERMSSWGQKTIRRYTNHEDDPDSGAIYMQAREQLPAYGKFAQVDPAYDQTKDDPESWNLYTYVTNNPVTHTDPDGRYEVIIDGLTVVRNNDVLDELGISGSIDSTGGGPPITNWDPGTGVIYLGSHLNANGDVVSTFALPGSNGNGAMEGQAVSAQAGEIVSAPETFDSSGRVAGGPNLGDPTGGGSYWNTSVHTEDKKETTDEGATHRIHAVDIDRKFNFWDLGDILNFSSSQRYASEVTSIEGEKNWFGRTLFAAGSAEHEKGQIAADGTAKLGLHGIGIGGTVTLGGPGVDVGGKLGFRLGGYKISVISLKSGVGLTGGAKASLFSRKDGVFKLVNVEAILGLKIDLDLFDIERDK